MSKPQAREHTASRLRALSLSAEKARDLLLTTADGLERLPKELGIDRLLVKQSGTIDMAMKAVLKFSLDAFQAFQSVESGSVPRKSDTDNGAVRTSDKQRQRKSDTPRGRKSSQVQAP